MTNLNGYPTGIIQNDDLDSIRMKAFDTMDSVKLQSKAMNRERYKTFGVSKDIKTKKGELYGYRTAIMYLAPANVSGIETCHSRTKGCTSSCLFTSGNGMMSNVKMGRIRRTYLLEYRRELYLDRLVRELEHFQDDTINYFDMIPTVRLNGTSDINWESIPVKRNGTDYDNIFDAFKDLQFYDYTKKYNRLAECESIANYHLTFSRAETKLSAIQTKKALENGHSVAVVFHVLKSKPMPETWNSYKVVNGDESDLRFNDKNVVVGLKAKRDAISDTSGFVVR